MPPLLGGSQLATLRGLTQLEPRVTAPWLALTFMNDSLWEFMDLAERLWLTTFERYPVAASKVGPDVAAAHANGRSRVLVRELS
jgi:hypothetical protein